MVMHVLIGATNQLLGPQISVEPYKRMEQRSFAALRMTWWRRWFIDWTTA